MSNVNCGYYTVKPGFYDSDIESLWPLRINNGAVLLVPY